MPNWYRRALIRLYLLRLRTARDVLRFAGRRYAEHTALVSPSARLTFAQLQDRVLRLSAGWEHHGVGHGSHVFSLLRDDHEQIEVRLAAAETGAIPTSFHQAHPLELILKAARLTPPSVFVYDAGLGGTAAERLQREQQSVILLRTGAGGTYEGLLGEHVPRASHTRLSAQDPAGLGFTSGTTGEPKALFVRNKSVMESLKRVVRHVRVPPRAAGSVFLLGIPLIGAGSGVVLPALLAGGTIVIPPRYEARELVRLIEQEHATRLFVTPSLLIDILDLPDLEQRDLSSLEGLIYGSETTAAAKIEEAIRRLGPILQQGYGMAEVHPPLSMLQPEEHVCDGKPAPREVLRSVGRPVPGVDVRVVDGDGRSVAPGEIGEFLIRSPTMFAGYWQRPDLTEQALSDGYMRTSDYGFIDADGRLHVLNRRSDLVQRDGHTIYPRLVEEVIHDHSSVKEACLVQVDGAAVLCVSLRHDWRHRLGDAQLAGELLSFVAGKVEPWQRPDRIEVMAELPRSFLGKVLRREVRQALAIGPSASPSTTQGETA